MIETAQMSISGHLNKQIAVYTYNEIVFSHQKEWSTETRATWMNFENIMLLEKKSVTKGHMLNDSIYMICPDC